MAIYPPEVEPGENVFVGVKVKNTGDNRRTESLKLVVEGEVKTKEITLDGGENKTITFAVSREIEGEYNVSISDFPAFSGNFQVEVPPPSPPRFKENNLEISPSQVTPDEKVEISVLVKNFGGSEGSHTVELKVDGNPVEDKNVDLEPGESQTVSFHLDRTTTKTFSVEVGGQRGSFVVTPAEPAESEVSNLSVGFRSDAPDFCSYLIGVSVDVANVGGKSGENTVELQVYRINKENYDVIENVYTDSREVSLNGGESKTVSFKMNLDFDNLTYKFSVEGLEPEIHTYTRGEDSSS